MDLFEKTLEQNYVMNGRIINVRVDKVELCNGKTSTREVVEHPGGVCVAPLTDNGKLLFVKQYRYPYSEVLLELPAGKLEKGEDPLSAGIRELKEETGAVAQNVFSLGKDYPTVAYCTEIIHIYCATGLRFEEQDLDEDEFIELEEIDIDTAVEMVMTDKIRDSKTQIAILKIARMIENGEIEINRK